MKTIFKLALAVAFALPAVALRLSGREIDPCRS